MLLYANAKLGLGGRFALVRAVEGHTALSETGPQSAAFTTCVGRTPN
jgi:hypothetical protein